jgi:hypothetical protein
MNGLVDQEFVLLIQRAGGFLSWTRGAFLRKSRDSDALSLATAEQGARSPSREPTA